jgi:hypothetical protein
MASTISAATAGGGGIIQSADASGNLNLQSGTTTILALTSTGVAITGTLSASGGMNDKIQPITASVGSSALTITLNPTSLDFRSATIGSGTVTTVSNSAAISVVVPSTATLGTVNAVQNRLVVLAINNSGTMELAVTNISGGSGLSETGVISTTLIAAASNSATLYYSTTARTGVAYRVVGYIESTQATAGTWATAPSTIQGYGGQAVAAMSSLGYGQTWQTVTRAASTTYYNTTSKPIMLNLMSYGSVAAKVEITVGSLANSAEFSVLNLLVSQNAIIPVGSSYSFAVTNGTRNGGSAAELR